MTADRGSSDQPEHEGAAGESLAPRVAAVLRARQDVITADAVALVPSEGPQRLDTDYCLRFGALVVLALADAVEHGGIDYRSQPIAELTAAAAERSLSPEQVFTIAHLAERTAIDELALDVFFDATTGSRPVLARLVREAVLHLLAAWTTRLVHAPSASALTDTLTTLYTRAVFEAALSKECHRAERVARSFAVFLVDVDALGALNQAHGYGVGDRVLERLGILLRTFFRQHDWVARYEGDAFAVLLPETNAGDAATLAERARTMVAERLAFRDYQTDRRVVVTVSVAVITVEGLEGTPVQPQEVLDEAENAIRRATSEGRGVVEHVRVP